MSRSSAEWDWGAWMIGDLADVVRRVPLRIEAAENLIAVGAADGFGLGRREALWQLGLFLPARAFRSSGAK